MEYFNQREKELKLDKQKKNKKRHVGKKKENTNILRPTPHPH